jgi:cobalamin biosynthesis Co2+ chelatase CbiK
MRALEEGWQLSELSRMFICLGANLYFLRLRNPEFLERFKLLVITHRAYGALDMALRKRQRRRNEPKNISKTTLLPLHLPRGLHHTISTYSDATGVSKNALMSRFLEAGFIIYMLGENALFKTLVSLQHDDRRPGGKAGI